MPGRISQLQAVTADDFSPGLAPHLQQSFVRIDEAQIEVMYENTPQNFLGTRKLKLKEIYQHLLDQFFELEEALEKEEEDVCNETMEWWLKGLERANDPFIKNSVTELLRGDCIMVSKS